MPAPLLRRIARAVLLTAIAATALTVTAQDHTMTGEPRAELESSPSIALDPASGGQVGFVYAAYLSPQQEGGEEEDTPALIPPQFRSTAPSVPRNERTSRGHATLEFTRDLSRAYVYLAIENVDVSQIVMLHLHCGRPGQLGPIIVDFSLMGDVQTMLADGVLAMEIRNEDIVAVTDGIASPVDAFTRGCPIDPSNPADKMRTVAGLEVIAREGDIYFNLHTAGQVYFGDIRGQFYLASSYLD